LKRYQAQGDLLTLDFGNHFNELIKLTTHESREIVEIISGYISLIMSKR